MSSWHYIDKDSNGDQVVRMLTTEQAGDLIDQLLSQPPVQFDRLHNADGWKVSTVGHQSLLIKIDPTQLN